MIVRRKMRRGATAVEAAFVLPVVFLIVIGIIVGGLSVFRHQQAYLLAHEAARDASVRGGVYDAETATGSPTEAAIIAAAVTPMAAGSGPADWTVTIEWVDRGTGTATPWDTAPKDIRSVSAGGEYVANTVRVTVTYRVIETYFGDPVTVCGVSEIPMSH